MSLFEHVGQIEDPRDPRGVRHPAGAIIKAVMLALISGMTCMEHIAEYISQHWEELADELGFRHWHPPDGNTISRLLEKLDSEALSRVFESWLSELLQGKTFNVSLDGKSCRGVVKEGKPDGKALYLLNAFAHDVQVALAQYPLEDKKGESTVAKEHIGELIQKYPGIVLFTLDAGLSGRNLCETIIHFERDYLVRIKGNQPDLEEALCFWFEAHLKKNPKPDAKTVEKKKGETITRELFLCESDVVTYLREELNYPGLQQAAVLRKTFVYSKQKADKENKTEIWYLLTSRKAENLPAKAFLTTTQKHWQVENGLHHVKDRTMKEDQHYTTSPEQETSLAILRNVIVSILNLSTPPLKRKISRPIEFLRNCLRPVKALKILLSL